MRAPKIRNLLNRLIVVCRHEVMALEAAALSVGGDRRRRLELQVSRRVLFQEDLARVVGTLGGAPPKSGSPSRRLANAIEVARSFFVRSRRVELYEACTRATDKTALVYSRILKLNELPAAVRLQLERQRDEVECDRNEIRWLRSGAALSGSPSAPHRLGDDVN